MSWFFGRRKQESSSSEEDQSVYSEEALSDEEEEEQPDEHDPLNKDIEAQPLLEVSDHGTFCSSDHDLQPSMPAGQDPTESARRQELHTSHHSDESSLYDGYSTSAAASEAPFSDEEDLETTEHILKGVIPGSVQVDSSDHPRLRADSALSLGDDEEDDEQASGGGDSFGGADAASVGGVSKASTAVDDEEEQVTSAAEKHSLLVLAAEHDRVDILQAILSDDDRHELLSSSIPPLHIAVSYGSVNACNCLLRLGADPSIRPDVDAIEAARSPSAPVEIPNIRRFDGVTAWELVFGDGTEAPPKSAWSLFGGSSSNLNASSSDLGSTSHHSRRKKTVTVVDIAPSKREGIRHAFTAEALRCIGSDEVDRLRQLLASGMPESIDIGGKTLQDWSFEMGAKACAALLQESSLEKEATATEKEETAESANGGERKKSIVLDRMEPGQESIPQLEHRLDELESLARALSLSLDGLAEEVSVCNGLLLMGGGAAALAAHVRSLRATKERRLEELERIEEAWENSEDELAYWVKEGGADAEQIASQMRALLPIINTPRRQSTLPPATTKEEEEAQLRQLKAQVAASEHKVRKLRASIADLSEACARELAEVEKRGLTGGINLVRSLRDEIREIEFQLSEAKSGEAACRTKISLIQSNIHASKRNSPVASIGSASAGTSPAEAAPIVPELDESASKGLAGTVEASSQSAVPVDSQNMDTEMRPSERIATGRSTAIAVRTNTGRNGFLAVSLWQILLRIIGLGSDAPSAPQRSASTRSSTSQSQPVMLI